MTEHLTRRTFLAGAAAAGAVTSIGLHGQQAAAHHGDTPPGRAENMLCMIYLRGGVDGLSLVPPTAYGHYNDVRPTVGIPSHFALPLQGNDMWGLHPALQPLQAEWDAGNLSFVHGAGLDNPSRSHFKSMELTEIGVSNTGSGIQTGWLGRYLNARAVDHPSHHLGAAVGFAPDQMLAGYGNALALPSVESAGLAGRRNLVEPWQIEAMQRMLGADGGDIHTTLDQSIVLNAAVQAEVDPPEFPDGFTPSTFDSALATAAALFDSPLGVQAITVTLAGPWDMHADQGGLTDGGKMSRELDKLGKALRFFFDDLETRGLNVTTVAMSEFGRRVEQNGSNGTDHGKGGIMMVHTKDERFNGSQVISVDDGRNQLNDPADVPFLIDERGDVKVTTPYQDVLADVSARALGDPDSLLSTELLDSMFPGFTRTSTGLYT